MSDKNKAPKTESMYDLMVDVFGKDKVGTCSNTNQPQYTSISRAPTDEQNGVHFHYNPTINVSSNTSQDSKNNPSLSEVGSLLVMLGGLLAKFIK